MHSFKDFRPDNHISLTPAAPAKRPGLFWLACLAAAAIAVYAAALTGAAPASSAANDDGIVNIGP